MKTSGTSSPTQSGNAWWRIAILDVCCLVSISGCPPPPPPLPPCQWLYQWQIWIPLHHNTRKLTIHLSWVCPRFKQCISLPHPGLFFTMRENEPHFLWCSPSFCFVPFPFLTLFPHFSQPGFLPDTADSTCPSNNRSKYSTWLPRPQRNKAGPPRPHPVLNYSPLL